MIEFINNNVLSSIIFLTFFFMNKNFHSHMSFDSDIIKYESIQERLQINWIKNIFEEMNKTLIFACKALIKTWKQMMNQTNKHRKKINYKIESKMFLNEQNIITAKSFKKLNDKMLNSFQITESVDSFISWNYQRLCIYTTYFIQNFFILSLITFCLIKRMNLRD